MAKSRKVRASRVFEKTDKLYYVGIELITQKTLINHKVHKL